MRTIDANTLSGSARDTAGSTSNFANVIHCQAMKNSPRAEGLRDNSARKAAQRIVKEISARRNPISFDGTDFESSLGDV